MNDHAATIARAALYPRDRGFQGEVDAAHFAARVVMADLTDRRGIRQEFEELDDDVQDGIVSDLAAIVREGQGQKSWAELSGAVLDNLKGRSGLDQAFALIDDDILEEIEQTVAELIEQGLEHFQAHGAADVAGD